MIQIMIKKDNLSEKNWFNNLFIKKLFLYNWNKIKIIKSD